MFTIRLVKTFRIKCLLKIVVLLTAVILFPSPAYGEEKNIFILHTYSNQFPWREQFNTAIQEELEKRPDWKLYTETMDTPRLGNSLSPDEWVDYLSKKYSRIEFDAVLAESIPSSQFIKTYGEQLFGAVPEVIFIQREQPAPPRICYFSSQQTEAVLQTFQMAIKDNPMRNKIVIVEYDSPLYRIHQKTIEQIAAENGKTVSVLNDFTVPELMNSIGDMKGNEIIFYFLVQKDNSGTAFVPREVLERITEISPAPAYSFWSTLMGTGIVGGVMVDGSKSAKEMFRALDDYFRDGKFNNDYTTNSRLTDWRAARKYGIDLKVRTGETIFLNKPPPFMLRYFRPIVIALLITLLFTLFSRYQKSRANRKLRISRDRLDSEKEQLKVTLEGMAEGLITTDVEFLITEYNSYAEYLTGWKREEVLGKPVENVLPVVNEASVPVPFYMRDDEGYSPEQLYYLKKDGTRRDLVIRKAELHTPDEKVAGLVIVFQDDTQNRLLMNEIQKNEKLRSIGILAGGIAHDFNNLLAGIYGHVELASLICEPGSEVEDHLKNTLASFDRAKKLAGQLLTFSKGNTPSRELTALPVLIQDSINFVFSGKRIKPAVQINPDLWNCVVAKTQIEQVLENLMLNAIQSLSGRGGIYIEAENRELNGETDKKAAGKYVVISIRDDGTGIPPEELHRIFDPFYTTKEMGTGLGLTTTYSIINRHGGYIDVKSEVGVGTTFQIYLPAVLEQVTAEAALPQNTGVSYNRGTVLFMDDEPVLQGLAKKILSKEGFEVVIASEGSEAIALCKDLLLKKKMISAIILDLTIPDGMGGLEAVGKLKPLLPATVPIIAASGYSSDDAIAAPHRAGFTDGIAKPFLKEDLLKVISKYSA